MKFEWELIYRSDDKITETWRAKVHGGWLVKDFNCVYTDETTRVTAGVGGGSASSYGARRYAMSEPMVFIPDPDHSWHLN